MANLKYLELIGNRPLTRAFPVKTEKAERIVLGRSSITDVGHNNRLT
jgi:hypothetical protein